MQKIFGNRTFLAAAWLLAAISFPWTAAGHAQTAQPIRTGLWSGEITVNKVSEVRYSTYYSDPPKNDTENVYFANGDCPTTASDTAAEFNLNVLIHQSPAVPPDTPAKALLAKDVTVVRKEVEDGEYRIVLLTDDTLIPNYEGVVKRSGEMIGIRMGSVFYDFPGRTLEMAGAVGEGRILTASVACEEDFSSNPYRHLYHPDHGKGVEFQRVMVLKIRETPSETDDQGNPKRAGYGEEWLEGDYREKTTGLHKVPVYSCGTFVLQKISQVETLNDATQQ